MRRFLRILVEITFEAMNSFTYFIKNNLITFADILNLSLPYIMYFLGQYVSLQRGNITMGGEAFIPLIFVVIIFYLESTANKLGKGTTVPLPEKRFTNVDDDGEVSVEYERLQELILYVADIEDYLERKGLLN